MLSAPAAERAERRIRGGIAARTRRGAPARRGPLCDEQGSVTAEFVIVMPMVLVVLGLAIGGILISAHRVALVSLAAQVARFEARGDGDLAASVLSEWKGSPVEVGRSRLGGLHCVTLRSHPGGGLLAGIGIESLSCAAISGEGVPGGVPGEEMLDGGAAGRPPFPNDEREG